MDKEKIFELVQKQESELTEQDKEYLKTIVDDEQLKELITYNYNLIKYLNIKDKNIDISEEIIINFILKEIYEQLKNEEVLKKLNINNKNKLIYELFNRNEELIRIYEQNIQNKINEENIIKESSIPINEISNYLNDYTIMGLLYSGVDIPSITNNKEKINELIEKGVEDIIVFINTNLITEELWRYLW